MESADVQENLIVGQGREVGDPKLPNGICLMQLLLHYIPLGYTFQPRRAKNRWGGYFVSFLPAISAKAAKAIRKTIREWRMASTRNNQKLEDLARLSNPAVRGWMNYYGRFYRSKCVQVLRHLNKALARWAQRKYRRFRRRERASMYWLGRIARRGPRPTSARLARRATCA